MLVFVKVAYALERKSVYAEIYFFHSRLTFMFLMLDAVQRKKNSIMLILQTGVYVFLLKAENFEKPRA
jgi:hypothetical protein